MVDTYAAARRAIGAASAASPRLGGQAALAAFSSTGGRMPVRADDETTHDRARRGTVSVRDNDLITYRWGEGDDTVLLAHGWRGRASQFAPLVRELVAEGFHVVSFDAPAHGESPGRRADIRDWLAAITALQAVHGRFRTIVGHSFGALAALTAARDGVTTASVATIAGAGSASAFLTEFADAIALDDPTRARFEAAFRRRIGVDEASVARRFDAIAHPLPQGVDLLVAHDERDRQLSPKWSRQLFQAHRERARLVVTDGFGHARILAADRVLDAVVGLATGGLVGVDRALAPAIDAADAAASAPPSIGAAARHG